MDRRTGGQTDGDKSRWTYRRSDNQTEALVDRQTHEQMGKRTDE